MGAGSQQLRLHLKSDADLYEVCLNSERRAMAAQPTQIADIPRIWSGNELKGANGPTSATVARAVRTANRQPVTFPFANRIADRTKLMPEHAVSTPNSSSA
jgi:hypothetical protein